MSKVDQYEVIKWVNQLMETIEETKDKLHNVGVLLAQHKAGVDGLIGRDLQQRTLNKIVEQKIGLRLNEKTQHLYMTECRSIRKELSRSWYTGKRWVEDNQITDKESLRKLIRHNVEKVNADHFKELKDYQDKLKKKLLQDKVA